MKEVHFRLKNIPFDEYEKLKTKAVEKTGSASVAGLLRHLIKKELAMPSEEKMDMAIDHGINRIEIRLNPSVTNVLLNLAKAEHMTVNRLIVMLLSNYTQKEKIMSAQQIQVLRDSNYQLLKIGVNLNQLAKQANQGGEVSMDAEATKKLTDLIDEHTKKVGDVMATTPTL
ncbi:Bacterial mobilisation protein (MobC) [Oligella urethralis]|uniref:plasmid mobilization relaxosome protein MobC n=1 Tax=Oligella urethralis TaxID=90245 RepID=UPI000E04CD06|nr:plasmid mobilization relaxosome protein MobC [Oligella urethralis]SUA61608.1 Bacterial mobilisation protein (MobC) [Oligella urethralis]